MERILVVVAHPDDEVLGCGGTIARLAKEGHEVHVGVLSGGLAARLSKQSDVSAESLGALRKCLEKSVGILGVAHLYEHDFPDNRLDSVALLDVVKVVEGWLSCAQPAVVYSHYWGDLNVDHQAVSKAVLTATRPMEGCSVRDLFAFEVPSSTEWTFGSGRRVFNPNRFVDISDTLEIKIKAMSAYTSELREFPHPRSFEGIRTIAGRWGSVVGCLAAEAFEVVRSIR